MSPFCLTPVNAAEAAIFSRWTYAPGYGLYDFRAEDLSAFLDPRFRYHTVRQGGDVVGVSCFGERARVYGGPYREAALDLGCNMDPALVGQGRGTAFVAAIVAFAVLRFAPAQLRLTVAAANERAIRVYRKNGFATRGRFPGMVPGGIHQFLLMTRGTSREATSR